MDMGQKSSKNNNTKELSIEYKEKGNYYFS